MEFFRDENAAVVFCEQLRSMDILPDAIEYFDKAALDLLRQNRHLWQELPELKDNWQQAVYYEYSGDDEDILEKTAFKASDLAQEYGSGENDCWIVDKKADIEKMKLFRHAVPEAINMKLDALKLTFPDIAKISTDLAVPDDFLKEMLSYYRQAKEDGWDVIVFGHIGNNHLHTNIIPHNYEQYLEAHKLAKEWAKTAVKSGGTVSGEHGIGKSKTELLKIMFTKPELNKMKQIKQKFDPEGIFNPANIFSTDQEK
jgi:D-lactate dehydrogenase (cytochrome)